MNRSRALRCATAVALALMYSISYAADTPTGKQKATAIGATTGAVAGAVVGGPVGAVIGAGIGGVVGHEGTDAHGRVSDSGSKSAHTRVSGSTVRQAQAALNDQGFSVGAVDGQWGPGTQHAVRRFQTERGLSQTGSLDNATLGALGVNH